MPTYDYQCDACDHGFEAFQSMSANALKKCPECGKRKLRRLIGTGAGVIFKGSGFYETDYRSESYKQDAKKAQDAAKPAKDEKSATSKTDAPKTKDTSASEPKKDKAKKPS